MLALRKTQPAFGVELVSVVAPALPPSAGHVLIDVAAAGICGSDLHAYEWTSGYEFMTAYMPLTIGHEFSGVVRAVATDVTDIRVGDRVVCWPTSTCGVCPACRAGRPENCESRRTIGLHCDGGFAEQVQVPVAGCRVLPDSLSLEIAALTEPLAVSVNAVDLADVAPDDAVVVLGPGPIGMGAAWVAQHRGADVLLAGMCDDARLECALGMGVRRTVDLATESLQEAVQRAFGRKVDRVIEATGVARSIIDGLDVLRSGGILIAAGIHKDPCTFDLTRFVREKKQLRGAHGTTGRTIDEAIRLLDAHGDQLAHMITHREPLTRGVEALAQARTRQAVKILLLPSMQDGSHVS